MKELEILFRQIGDVNPDIKLVLVMDRWFASNRLFTLFEKYSIHFISRCYAERFEIEEAFKDIKWLNRLEWQKLKRPETIFSLLIFVFFGRWLFWWVVVPELEKKSSRQLVLNSGKQINLSTTKSPRRKKRPHPKRRLSWFKEAWEYLEQACHINIIYPIAEQGGIKK